MEEEIGNFDIIDFLRRLSKKEVELIPFSRKSIE